MTEGQCDARPMGIGAFITFWLVPTDDTCLNDLTIESLSDSDMAGSRTRDFLMSNDYASVINVLYKSKFTLTVFRMLLVTSLMMMMMMQIMLCTHWMHTHLV